MIANEESQPNVVQRLNQQIRTVKKLGFQVRSEVLGDQAATWCEVAGKKMLFLDVSQTAAEQLRQIEDLMSQYAETLERR